MIWKTTIVLVVGGQQSDRKQDLISSCVLGECRKIFLLHHRQQHGYYYCLFFWHHHPSSASLFLSRPLIIIIIIRIVSIICIPPPRCIILLILSTTKTKTATATTTTCPRQSCRAFPLEFGVKCRVSIFESTHNSKQTRWVWVDGFGTTRVEEPYKDKWYVMANNSVIGCKNGFPRWDHRIRSLRRPNSRHSTKFRFENLLFFKNNKNLPMARIRWYLRFAKRKSAEILNGIMSIH